MTNRMLTRVLTSRVSDWSEKYGTVDDTQVGFRQSRSTVDTTQTMVWLHEDKKGLQCTQDMNRARLLDLRKAYPLLWKTVKSYVFHSKFIDSLNYWH